jgi:hypothetical protein
MAAPRQLTRDVGADAGRRARDEARRSRLWGRQSDSCRLSRRSTVCGVSSEDPFGLFGDPDELRRRMAEFAEQMQGAQKVAWADNAIKLAVDMTVAAITRINLQGSVDQQAADLRQAMSTLFPEAVTLVREAREGFGTA